MAEASSSPSSSSSTSGTTSTSGSQPLSGASVAPASKQYIRASTDDNALEPDALRGSEHVMRDLDIQDDEEDRRDMYRKEEDKTRSRDKDKK